MAHSDKYISQVQLPGSTDIYEIHDAKAIHDITDLNLATVLVFGGTKSTEAEIKAITTAKRGEVWLATSTNTELVCTADITGTASASSWEMLGKTYDAASSAHKHTVTVTGTNTASSIDGSVTIPTVSRTQKYLKASAGAPTITPTTDNVLGADTVFTVNGGDASATKTKISAIASGAAVGANGTASAITALGTPTTASAITALNTTTIKNPTVTAGSAASWTATVSNGVLSFGWTANTPTAVSTSDVTVATGSKSTANAITAFNAPTTKTVLTGVKVTAQPTITVKSGTTGDVEVVTDVSVSDVSVSASGDIVAAMTGASASAPAITLTQADSTSTGAVPVVSSVSIGSTTAAVSGTAAAQTWKQGTVTVSTPN